MRDPIKKTVIPEDVEVPLLTLKVLIAIDRRSCADEMIDFLKAYSLPAQTDVLVLHVIEPHTSIHSWPSEQFRAEALELTTYAKNKLADAFPHLRFESKIVDGQANEKILEVATEFDADLILVGSIDRSGIRRFFGKVPSAIVLQAPCSVIVLGHRSANALRTQATAERSYRQ